MYFHKVKINNEQVLFFENESPFVAISGNWSFYPDTSNNATRFI